MLSAPNPFSFILFGASGHLAKLKIYPSFYVLALKKRLPKHYSIVGFSRTHMTDEAFRDLVRKAVIEDQLDPNKEVLDEFLTHVFYHQGQYTDVKDYQSLHTKLASIEAKWGNTVRLAYFSVPPSMFPHISLHLCEGGVHKTGQEMRCIVEKPVGSDLESFEQVHEQLTGCFQEEDVYLLDHYLGKEAVRNIYYLRFANPILERILKNTLIHHVEITASESAGIENRAGYFDNTGTFRDMFQSHLLMVIALLTMRLKEGEEGFRSGRINALEQIYLPPAKHLDEIVLQGQYAQGSVKGEKVVGYTEEENIESDSRANTYAALKLMTRISKWEGVPFYLRSGKRLEKKETRISIEFQEPHSVGEGSSPNRLDIILQGEAGMRLHLQTKLGGTEPVFRPLILEDPLVCVGDCLPEHGLLLLEAIHGKRQWFLTFKEVQTAWRLVDPLQAHLDKEDTSLYHYIAGTHGPEEANAWIAKDRKKWMYS